MKLEHSLTPCTKIKSKWIKDLNARAKTTKLLGENTGRKLHDIGFGNNFLDVTPKAQVRKKIIHWSTSKLKPFVCKRTLSAQ